MKIFSLVFLLVVAGSVSGQSLTQQIQGLPKPKEYHIKYDRFKDVTTVWHDGMFIKGIKGDRGATAPIRFLVGFDFEGDDLAYDIRRFRVEVSAYCDRICFDRDRGMIILADGQRFVYPKGDVEYDTQNGSHVDTLFFTINRADVETIAAAKLVEVQVQDREARFTGEQLALIGQMIKLGTLPK